MKPEVVDRIIAEVTEQVMKHLQSQKPSNKMFFIGKKPDNVSLEMLAAFFSKEKKELLVIGWHFSWDSLMRCSQMIPQTEEEKQLMQALFEGKSVYIVKEKKYYFPENLKLNYSIKEKIKEMEKALCSYGANFIYLSHLMYVDHKFANKLIFKSNQRYVTGHQLQRMKLQQNTVLSLPVACRLTDMAYDFINEKEIKIKYDN